MHINGFDWDDANLNKCQKHGISKDIIETIFAENYIIIVDDQHSYDESRYWYLGKIPPSLKVILVVFTFRVINNKLVIRPISARYLNRKELKKHDKEIAKI